MADTLMPAFTSASYCTIACEALLVSATCLFTTLALHQLHGASHPVALSQQNALRPRSLNEIPVPQPTSPSRIRAISLKRLPSAHESRQRMILWASPNHDQKTSPQPPWYQGWATLLMLLPAAFFGQWGWHQFQKKRLAGGNNMVNSSGSISQNEVVGRRLILQGSSLVPFLLSCNPAMADLPEAVGKLEFSRMEEIDTQAAEDLIDEFSSTVSKLYYDAYGTGFDQAKWARLTEMVKKARYEFRQEVYGKLSQLVAKARLDDSTYFLRPEQLKAISKFDGSGVGLSLVTGAEYGQPTSGYWVVADDDIVVEAVLPGTAAEDEDISAGDIIEQVDGVPVQGTSPFLVTSSIRGEALAVKTSVRLRIRRIRDGQVKTITLPRPPSPLPDQPVKAELKIENAGDKKLQRGLITISEFSDRTAMSLSTAIQFLEAEGASDFILDLRGNSSGEAQDAVESAKLFLNEGAPITYLLSNAGELLERVPADNVAITDKPVIILVDSATASAAEIFAAALRDNCRAVLVGRGRTAGRAVTQGIYSFADGSGVQMTTGTYLTPLRKNITGKGLKVDFPRLEQDETVTQTLSKKCDAPPDAVSPS